MAEKKKTGNIQEKTAAAPEARAAETGAMVTVAYNAPRGMIFTVGDERIHINGNNAHLIGKEKGILSVGRYGYTRITADAWEAVKTLYGSMAIFQTGPKGEPPLIFAEKSGERAEDRAEEQAEARHGLEPVDTAATRTTEARAGTE